MIISRHCLIVVASLALTAGGLVMPARASAVTPADLFVAPAGSDSNDCTSSVDPCHTLTRAISVAAASGTTIHAAKGHYQDAVNPGSKHVTVVGTGTDQTTGTVISDPLGLVVKVDDPAGMLSLKSLTFGGDPFGAWVTDGILATSHVNIYDTRCAIVMSGGQIRLTDSAIIDSGILTDQDCRPLSDPPVAVTVNGGTLSLVRSRLADTMDEPGIVINGGTFSATDSEFSDAAHIQSNTNPTVHNAGGAATFKRSLFTADRVGLQLTGGTTTIADSTFYGDEYGIATTGGVGDYPLVLRSTLIGAVIYGPAALGGVVLSAQGAAVCTQQVIDYGYNYETGGSCAFSAPTSHNGAATMNLDAASAAHGGPTQTVAVSAPSALINAIPTGAKWGPDGGKPLCRAGSTDQRGVPRPQGGACDAGAFEATASQTALTASPNPAAPGSTVTLSAHVTPNAATFHDPDPVAGTVTFKTGTSTLCSKKTVDSAGIATCTTSQLPAGTPTVTASFASTSPYLASTGTARPVVATMPKFTTSNTARATVGVQRTITVRASGNPAASITKTSGALPSGMHFTGGDGTATISGRPARGTAKKYVLHLHAANVRGGVNQTFTLTVVPG